MMYTRVLLERGEVGATFAADDRIFLGEGLFETLRVESSKPCCAYLHWQRLSSSAQSLGIPFDLSFDDWHDYLVQQIKGDNLYHGGIKVILSGGSAPRGLAEQGQISQLLLQTFNYSLHSTPLKLMSASWLRDAANPIYQLKSVNYLEAIQARRHALAKGADDALFFNTRHHVTETTCANVFIIKDNALYTPALSDGVLAGIARRRILAYCKSHDIPCFEQSLSKDRIEDAEVVFTSNSLQGMRLVSSVDDFYPQTTHILIDQLSQMLAQDFIGNV